MRFLENHLVAPWHHGTMATSAGSETCSGGGRQNCHPPGSFGHYAADAQTLASWGVDYVKMDWCGSNLTDPQQQHTEFSNALNGTGRHIWLELCRGYGWPPPPYVAEVAQSYRLSGSASCLRMWRICNLYMQEITKTAGRRRRTRSTRPRESVSTRRGAGPSTGDTATF